MNRNPDLVQFLHPGGEHSESSGQEWNTGKHQRKFMRVEGKYLEPLDSYHEQKSDTIVFWGEWEPPAEYIKSFPENEDQEPNHLFSPFGSYQEIIDKTETQVDQRKDTDPFVFGDQFLYSICQQNRNTGPTHLQELDEGSVILFGSHKSGYFILDTVFVVADAISHCQDCYSQISDVPDVYQDVVLDPTYKEKKDSCSSTDSNGSCGCKSTECTGYTLYFGATPEDPVDDMFSFFPCLPYEEDCCNTFQRPHIDLDIIKGISNGMTQSYKYNFDHLARSEVLTDTWKSVVKKIDDSDLKLGVHAECPTKTL